MIKVFWANANNLLRDTGPEGCLTSLPEAIQAKITSYTDKNDRAVRILSRLMLLRMLRETVMNDKITLDELQYTPEGKPYFPGAPFNFSSTHSGPLVVGAMVQKGLIGVDAEQIRPVPADDLADYFTADEWTNICGAEYTGHESLRLWSRKEAVLKATGRGLFQPMHEIEVIADEVTVNGQLYFLHTVHLDPGYIVHLATSEKDPLIRVSEFTA